MAGIDITVDVSETDAQAVCRVFGIEPGSDALSAAQGHLQGLAQAALEEYLTAATGRPYPSAVRDLRELRLRSSAAWLALIALGMWVLLLDEIEDKVDAAMDHDLAFDTYSTPDAVFFVVANVWLVIAIYLCFRIKKLQSRIKNLD